MNSEKNSYREDYRGCRFCSARQCQYCLTITSGRTTTVALKQIEKSVSFRQSGERGVPILSVATVSCDTLLIKVLGAIFKDIPEFESAGFFLSGEAALSALPHLNADLMLVDIAVPDICGLRLVTEFRTQIPLLEAIVVTHLRDPFLIRQALTVGASQFLIQPVHIAQCIAALRLAFYHLLGRMGERGLTASSPNQGGGTSHYGKLLDSREQQLLQCLAEGLLYKEIEQRLCFSHPILRKLQTSLYRKLDAQNRMEAVRNAGLLLA